MLQLKIFLVAIIFCSIQLCSKFITYMFYSNVAIFRVFDKQEREAENKKYVMKV